MIAEEGEWHECVVNPDYEINDAYPYPIRRKDSDKIISESINKSTGYVECSLNAINFQKHRIIAQQFIPNDDEIHKFFIDHIDRNRTNNHISNLRWVSYSENNKNKSSSKGVQYEYFDSIDENAIEITDYGAHHFEFLYYVEATDSFYYYNGVQYRKLHINTHKNKFATYIAVRDTENKPVKISLNKYEYSS